MKNFQKILRLRTIFKSVSQISWNISQVERRYPLDDLDSNELDSLATIYAGEAKDLVEVAKKLTDELKDELETTDTD